MPLYKFACPEHVTEQIAPVGAESASCHCGARAERVPVFGAGFVVEPATVPRDQQRIDLSLFREATEEREHLHHRNEERAQRELRGPNLWRAAKRRAALVQAGMAPPPRGRA